ncbi:recombinase family protein [Intestinibacter sp.]
MATYYYMRISTKEKEDKQSYSRQNKALENYAKENELKYNDRYIYKDDVTGSTFNRTNWIELEENLKEGDTIVFKEISRFTRQAEEGYKKYMELMNKGIDLIFLDNPTVSTDYIKQLTSIADSQQLVTRTALEGTIKLLLIVELDRVEQERKIICKRIKDGLKAKKKENPNFTTGRAKGQVDKLSDELRSDIINLYFNKKITKLALSKKYSISRTTLDKYITLIKEEQNK